jgi:hypothetical protein
MINAMTVGTQNHTLFDLLPKLFRGPVRNQLKDVVLLLLLLRMMEIDYGWMIGPTVGAGKR